MADTYKVHYKIGNKSHTKTFYNQKLMTQFIALIKGNSQVSNIEIESVVFNLYNTRKVS